MEQVAKLLNGKGNIAILTGPSGDAGGLQRMEGYENILKNYPEIKQVVAPAGLPVGYRKRTVHC